MKGGHVAKSGKLSTIRRFSRGQKTSFGQGLLMGERLYLFLKLYSIHVYIAVAGNHATDRFRRRIVRLSLPSRLFQRPLWFIEKNNIIWIIDQHSFWGSGRLRTWDPTNSDFNLSHKQGLSRGNSRISCSLW